MRQAVQLAGIPMECIIRVVAEPVAAAFTYFMEKFGQYTLAPKEVVHEVIIVSDEGGGTYDCTVIEFFLKQVRAFGRPTLVFQVLDLAGDNDLGGQDYTYRAAVSYEQHIQCWA